MRDVLNSGAAFEIGDVGAVLHGDEWCKMAEKGRFEGVFDEAGTSNATMRRAKNDE